MIVRSVRRPVASARAANPTGPASEMKSALKATTMTDNKVAVAVARSFKKVSEAAEDMGLYRR
jgi:hypothetical protein